MGCCESKANTPQAEAVQPPPSTKQSQKNEAGDDKKKEELSKNQAQETPQSTKETVPDPPPVSDKIQPTQTETTKTVKLIHFNDVYNVERAPRFVTSLQNKLSSISSDDTDQQQPRPAVIFSGDAFNPSPLSTILRGTQMIPILNECHIDAACLGNHDLDFGLEEFEQLRKKCSFPWICSNAVEKSTGRNLGGCDEFVILDLGGGVKCLVLGLIEADWMSTLSAVEPEDILYEDYNAYVTRRVPEITLERNDGVPFDLVVAATHMRMNNDYKLAEGDGGKYHVDLILGGHDHHWEDTTRGERDVRILNSGTDFNGFTVVEVDLPSDEDGEVNKNGEQTPLSLRPKVTTRTEHIEISKDDEEHPEILAIVEKFLEESNKSKSKIIGVTKTSLDARFSSIRTKETNTSNFLADLMLYNTDAQIAILNSGVMRSNKVIPPGKYILGNVCRILPQASGSVVVRLTGKEIIQALENGVSAYPSMEGRFPCVAGVRFEFDPSKKPGNRISPDSVSVRRMPKTKEELDDFEVPMKTSYNPSYGLVYVPTTEDQFRFSMANSFCSTHKRRSVTFLHRHESFFEIPYDPIDLEETYTVVTTEYLSHGRDGYDVFKDAPMVHDEEGCPVLPTIICNYFISLSTMRKWYNLMPVNRTVLRAANAFYKFSSASDTGDGRGSVSLDPYAIRPMVDGRICNIALKKKEEEERMEAQDEEKGSES